MKRLRPYRTMRRDMRTRSEYHMRLDDTACIPIKEYLPERFRSSFSALVEDALVNYESALSYYTKSKPAWDAIIKNYPDNIAPIAKAYHPSLHYQFADPKIHCDTKHGYYLRLRSFSVINAVPSISAELFIPGSSSVPLQNLSTHDIAPVYFVSDFAHI